MWNPVAPDVGLDIGPASPNHGADPLAGERRKDPEPERTGTPEHADEHRLGPVVCVVSRRDPARAGASGRRRERLPARGPSPCLQVAAGADQDARPLERYVEGASERLGQVQLCRSLGPETVIDSVCEEAEGQLPSQEAENMEEGHRVRSAAHRHDDGRAASDEPMVAHGGAHERDQRGRMGSRQCLLELEGLAELDLGSCERAPPGGGGVVERASVDLGVEVRAVVACEAEVVARHLEAKTLVDPRLHGRRRSSATTASAWLV